MNLESFDARVVALEAVVKNGGGLCGVCHGAGAVKKVPLGFTSAGPAKPGYCVDCAGVGLVLTGKAPVGFGSH